jgi:hypothetical protein
VIRKVTAKRATGILIPNLRKALAVSGYFTEQSEMRPFLFSLLLLSFNQTQDKIVLKTRSGDTITVSKGIIHFNAKPISLPIDGVIYNSKYNRLIEQNSSTVLFLEIDNSPNLNELEAFKVTSQKAFKLAECVYNDKKQGIGPAPFTDMDKDGKLEFGGFDVTEFYDSKDSMYYNPSQYYEISNGTVRFDSALTEKMDIKINGMYLRNPLDNEGNCCVVIRKQAKKSSR